jgi:integrase/recombinase XerD
MSTQNTSPPWDDMIRLWAHGRPESTMSTYRPVIAHFRNFIGQVPIGKVTLEMLQDYANLFKKQQPRTVARKMSTIKSLLGFAYRMGATAIDVSRLLRIPKVPDDLAQKILPQKEIQRIISGEPDQRNKVLLTLLYCTGIRASEASGLRWLDCRERGKGGQITVLGKRGKKRSIRLAPEIWKSLQEIHPPNAPDDQYVFLSREGFKRPLDRTQITHMVSAAAKRVGLEAKVTAHWMRHAHATHAMDAGAPLPLISQTLGHASIATTNRYLHVSPDVSSSEYIHWK